MAQKVIDLKGSILSLTILKLFSEDFAETKAALEAKVAQAPDFFVGIPIVLEPQVVIRSPTFLARVVEFCHQLQLVPIGIRTEDEVTKVQAEYVGLGVFPTDASRRPSGVNDVQIEQEASNLNMAMTVRGAIRSGQQIYAQNRDLIVIGTVNPGAEVVADGHVFVFGKVMGKVFAGSSGGTEARVFAKELNPELICIGGVYLLADDMPEKYKTGWVEACLHQDKIEFQLLD